MFSSVLSATICGIESHLVYVEADVSDGLPMFSMVGYLNSQVREAGERVKTAMRNSQMKLSPKKITVNLSPADLRKEGAGFDLPIAIAVLAAYGHIPAAALTEVMIIGELSLSGEVNGVRGILPIVRHAAQHKCKICIVPKANEREGAMAASIQVVGVKNLKEAFDFLTGRAKPEAPVIDIEEILNEGTYGLKEDFKDINGQVAAKRATEVAVAGMHNLLLIGPPGSGKSMIAKRIPGILPKLSLEENLEISAIYSVAGLLNEGIPLLSKRPFRAPHHTISPQALAGGGRIPRPGEVSLAHRGVLFLDEMPEFHKTTLEILRQPLEERKIHIARASGNYEFPTSFMLVAAMNPCKCGHYPDMNKCSCSVREVQQYLRKISQPLLDRIDISVEAPLVEYRELVAVRENETSETIRERVAAAHEIQQKRYQNTPFYFNSDLNVEGIKKYCTMGKAEQRLLKEAFGKLHLSTRAYYRIIKVARTIADLEKSDSIQCDHVGEAICYRAIDRKFWT